VSPLHASIAILGCHPLYVRRLWLGKTTAKVGYGLRYVNTYYGLLDLHFGLIRWDLHEPNFIYQAHHLFPTETLSGLADPPTPRSEAGSSFRITATSNPDFCILMLACLDRCNYKDMYHAACCRSRFHYSISIYYAHSKGATSWRTRNSLRRSGMT